MALHRAAASITANELQTHVNVLADDSFEGRESGTRGGRAAGMYLLKQLEQRGLRGGGDDAGFFQAFGEGYRNVLGFLEGSDPELKRQVIVVSAHYDHVGYGTRRNSYGPFGYVHNGADDNASGTAGILETIDACLAMPTPPKRSILFAFWDGEEKGLLGSKHWVAHPTIDLANVAFMINVDMIGRMKGNQIEVFGSRTAPGLRRLVSEINFGSDLELKFNWELKANSDHHSFISHSIPALMFHTGLHDDYHRPSDDAHKLNPAGMELASRLLFGVAYEVADRSDLGSFRPEGPHETPNTQQQLEQPLAALPPRLGVRWYSDDDGPGLLLAHIERGTAAERAGLLVNDRLISFAGKVIIDQDEFRSDVLFADPKVEVIVERTGEEQPLKLLIELDGSPTRLGVAWREDAGEPGTVIVTRVVSGSPGSLAGLETGDRIYAIANEPFTAGRDIFEKLTTLPSPIELTIERGGRIESVSLNVPPPRG
ncbi:MAG: M20/M25/M40 family metallo-hydrolase [Planctomycetaceae bacterium]|nr:M20/M25/M40 family metallo-hydrolase [Planctomycetales bacterium]MCB9924288.1 M20/M25/M40 family metallo-hydrolase [Planctomycetaceae bacterium]